MHWHSIKARSQYFSYRSWEALGARASFFFNSSGVPGSMHYDPSRDMPQARTSVKVRGGSVGFQEGFVQVQGSGILGLDSILVRDSTREKSIHPMVVSAP